MATTYIRAADGAAVPDSVALDSGRRLRPGYRFAPIGPGDYVGFDMAFMDHARSAPTRVILNDNGGVSTPAPSLTPLSGARELRDAIRANRHNSTAMPGQLGGTPPRTGAAVTAMDGAAVRDLIRSSRNR